MEPNLFSLSLNHLQDPSCNCLSQCTVVRQSHMIEGAPFSLNQMQLSLPQERTEIPVVKLCSGMSSGSFLDNLH